MQLLGQPRPDRCGRLPADRAGHSADPSEDHGHRRDALHLQKPSLQVGNTQTVCLLRFPDAQLQLHSVINQTNRLNKFPYL